MKRVRKERLIQDLRNFKGRLLGKEYNYSLDKMSYILETIPRELLETSGPELNLLEIGGIHTGVSILHLHIYDLMIVINDNRTLTIKRMGRPVVVCVDDIEEGVKKLLWLVDYEEKEEKRGSTSRD